MSSLFQRRHYEWLARFAGQHLNEEQFYALSSALYNSANENFDAQRFIRACERNKEFAHAPSVSVFSERAP